MLYPKVTIIGTGNLALHLGKSLEDIGISVVSVYSRDFKKAQKAAHLFYNAKPTDSLDFESALEGIFFICVTDNAILEVAGRLRLPGKSIAVHCSGSTSLSSIANILENVGVFYPLQTFSASTKISFASIPICIEASSSAIEKTLEKVATGLKAAPYFMDSQQRLSLHLSAVFACNFTNHLLSISSLLLKEEKLPFNLLHNLIAETIQKALENDPLKVQTGPALRHDTNILSLHEQILQSHPIWKNIYHLLSDDIQTINDNNSHRKF